MNLISLFHIYAVVITFKNGLFSIFKIRGIRKQLNMELSTSRATTEIRSIWGGIYLGLGIAGLVFPIPEVYKTLGIVYVVSNVIRATSMILDKSVDRAGIQGVTYESILAFFLFL